MSTIRLLALVGAAMLAGTQPAHASTDPPSPPDPTAAVEDLFDCLTALGDEVVRLAAAPDAVAVADALGDHGSSAADITGWVHLVTAPLDDPTWEALFGADGAFNADNPAIHRTSYDANPEAFRGGLMLSGVRLDGDGRPVAGAEAWGVALAGTAPDYPAPADGPFAGIGRAWRLDERVGAAQVNFVQYTTTFQPFRSDLFVVDGCEGEPDVGRVETWMWYTVALSGTDVTGLDEVRPETFAVVGGETFSDTVALASHRALTPVVLETSPRPPTPSPTPTPDATPTPSPDATPTPSPHATPTPDATPTPSPDATPTPTPTPWDEPELDGGGGGNGPGVVVIVVGGVLMVVGVVLVRRSPRWRRGG